MTARSKAKVWRGGAVVGVMLALLVAMDCAILPEHSNVYLQSVWVWAGLCVAVYAFSRGWDWPSKGDR